MKGAAPPAKRVAIIWTKFLPYHIARIRHLRKRMREIRWHLTAIEMASKDALYPFPGESVESEDDYICLFSGRSYRALAASTLHAAALKTLKRLQPNVVIAPSTPFPSGMAAVKYCLNQEKLCVMMDDAWEYSDRRGSVVSLAKKIIHRNIDVAFIPAETHASYYVEKGFPPDRIVYGVDVVDNDFFAEGAARARAQRMTLRQELALPEKYFIFVGRFIKRKGISTLLAAYRKYVESHSGNPWGLVLVGEGDELRMHEAAMADYPLVKFVGGQFGEKLCTYYGLAEAMILPSEVETWGLVVNEAMASGLPVLVSRGCGAGGALIEEGRNGWRFTPGDSEGLAGLMTRFSGMSDTQRRSMSSRSLEIIGNWSLDTFADSAIRASEFPRRERGNLLSDLLTSAWTGRISFYP